MSREIKIKKKDPKGEDGHRILSIRIKEETIGQLDVLALETNRSRNELINILLEAALKDVTVE